MSRADHVVMDTRTSEMHCEHCGDRQALPLPMNVTLVVALTDAYLKIHRKCSKREVTP